MTERSLMVLDEGTTSTRAILYAPDGRCLGVSQAELGQHYPQPGWVEHDAEEIWDRTLACARRMVAEAGGADRIAAIGIANQRETVVAWDRRTGDRLVPRDRMAGPAHRRALRGAARGGHERLVRAIPGLLLDPYFSATKMRWILDHVPGRARGGRTSRARHGRELAGLEADRRPHISDASNASRTLLLPLERAQWDSALCDLFGVRRRALPEVVDTCGAFARTRARNVRRADPGLRPGG
jgi:glycerol kinase